MTSKWIPTAQAAQMLTEEWPGKWVTDDYGKLQYVDGHVSDTFSWKRTDPQYPGLVRSMRTSGFDPNSPVWVTGFDPDDTVRNGHHRIAAAVELGLPAVYVTDVPQWW